MTLVFPALDRLAPAWNHDGACAVEGPAVRDCLFLESHSGCENLEGGTRVIGVGDDFVTPLILQFLLEAGFLFLALEKVDERLSLFRADCERIVRVVFRIGCHSENTARLDVHNDTCRILVYVVLFVCFLEILLNVMLDYLVNRQDDVIAVDRIDVGFVCKRHFVAVYVCRCDKAARSAFHIAFIECFDTVKPLLVGADKAEDMGCEAAEWIISCRVRDEIDGCCTKLIDKLAYPVGLFFFHALLEDGVSCLAQCLFKHCIIVHFKDCRDVFGNSLSLFIRLYFYSLDSHHFGACRHGKRLHISVIYASARRCYRLVSRLLSLCFC